MNKKVSDTKVPLEWDENLNGWSCSLLDHDWAELQCILNSDSGHEEKIPHEQFNIECSPTGNHCIKWIGAPEQRPQKIYASISVQPKSPERFLGMPFPVFAPLLGLFGILAGILLPTYIKEPNPDVKDQYCKTSIEWVKAEKLKELRDERDTFLPYKAQRDQENMMATKYPGDVRVLFLLGKSHGLRLESIKRLSSNSLSQNLLAEAESNYISSILKKDADLAFFTKGKDRGHDEAKRLLGKGEYQVLSGQKISGNFR